MNTIIPNKFGMIFIVFSVLAFDLAASETLPVQRYVGDADETNMSGVVYHNDLDKITASQFAAIRDCPELKYILTGVILYPGIFTPDRILERDRIIALAQAGKRIILKIWFGPGGSYNWSYCSYPNIAMQQVVRDYLFSIVDSVIDQIGPQNIYGMHMLEEDGHFGVDIDEPGHWWLNRDSIYSGNEDGNAYNNFGKLRALYSGPSDWCQRVPNVAQYFPEFKKDTGMDMHNLPNDPLAAPVLNRWMARRLWAGAHKEFLQHLTEKYPNIKRFVWGGLAYEWNGTAIHSLIDIVDGIIINPYNDTLDTHQKLGAIRALMPEKEMLVLLMDSDDLAEKNLCYATAYMNGAWAIGFYGSTIGDANWNTTVEIWQKTSGLPILNTFQPKSLIISGNTDNGASNSKRMLPFFKNPVALPLRDAADIDISGYSIIVLHYSMPYKNDLSLERYNMTGFGPDNQTLKNWVISGGILVFTVPYFYSDSPFFIPEEGIAWTQNKSYNNWYQPRTFDTIPEIAEKYVLASQYTLLVTVRQLYWGSGVSYDELPVGGVMEYGNGKIVILPALHSDAIMLDEYITNEEKNRWSKEMANYIADVVRGVAEFHDGTGLLAEEIIAKGEDFGLEYNDQVKEIRVKTIFDIFGQEFYSEIYKSGNLILGGPSNTAK